MKQLPKQLHIDILGDTIMMRGKTFNMSYTPGNHIVKEEFYKKGCWFGGIQHDLPDESSEAIQLEKDLVLICETILSTLKRYKIPTKEAITINDLLPGSLFKYKDIIALKTKYYDNESRPIIYIASTGERFFPTHVLPDDIKDLSVQELTIEDYVNN